MDSPALYFASGDSLYPGTALLLIAIAASPFLNRPWLVRLRNITAWLGLVMIVMSSAPFPWALDAVFLGAFALWILASDLAKQHHTWTTVHTVTTALLTGMLFLFSALEIPHRKMPKITGEVADHLVVIGDSISSGIDAREPPWPAAMQQITGIAVKNLARPGSQVIDAQSMVPFVTPDDRLVLIEIGGNDLLGGIPSSEFEIALNQLLLKLTTPGRTIVMFELPLLPHRIAFGQIQRRLARKYGVWLIPKRYFVDVLGRADATSDGLHLSYAGTQRMATLVAKALSPVLKPPASPRGEQRKFASRAKLKSREITEERTLSDHKQEDSFRVIDRRPFTSEGELRKEVVEEQEREARSEATKPSNAPATPEAKAPAATPPVDAPKRLPAFENLIRMLGQNAAMVLGAYADPRTGQPMIDPEAARELIDMLDALHEKTKGNLAPDEDNLLLDLLGKLKLTFVEINQAVAAQAVTQAKAKTRS